jgi:hypothetical protein
MSASSSSTLPAVSSYLLQAAVAQHVRTAVKAREMLSARGIRQALEIEFCRDLRAMKDLILRAIQATLEENEACIAEHDKQDTDNTPPGSKRRRLSKINEAPDELVHGDGASAKRARLLTTGMAQTRLLVIVFSAPDKCNDLCSKIDGMAQECS